MTEPAVYFEKVLSAYERAAGAVGSIEQAYRIGGETVVLEFAGEALCGCIRPALEHLAAAAGPEAGLRVRVWESAASGVSLPAPSAEMGDYLPRGGIRGFDTQEFSTYYNAGVGVFCMLSRSRNLAVYWTRSAQTFPLVERAAPLLRIFQAWMPARGKFVLHAAALGRNGRGVLLAGKGGSGKSTTTLACLQAGFDYLADDYCLAGLEPAPAAYSLYCSGKLKDDSLARLPGFRAQVAFQYQKDEQSKSLIYLYPQYVVQLPGCLALRAILLPRFSQTAAGLRPARAMDAVRALAPSTIFQLAGSEHGLHEMAGLARQLPVYWLDLGADLRALPAVIADLLAGEAA